MAGEHEVGGKTTGDKEREVALLNRSSFAHVPRARSSHESHIPDRVITVHQTR